MNPEKKDQVLADIKKYLKPRERPRYARHTDEVICFCCDTSEYVHVSALAHKRIAYSSRSSE